jgi:MSHA biogenesis protein MshN
MSLINAMLQDLDRRQALGTDTAVAAVRASAPPPAKPKREWFWATLAVLMAVSVAWVGWVAFQVMPRPIVTKLVQSAPAKPRPQPQPQAAPEIVPVAAAAQPEPVSPPVAEPQPPSASFETFRLAVELQTPPKSEPKAEPVRAPKPAAAVAPAPAAPKATSQGTVDKQERGAAGSTAAANEFRRAVALLNQGRVAEAQHVLAGVLKLEPAHANARQVYVALFVEQGRVEPARRLLEEGLKLAPGHPSFSLTLARIHTEQRDYASALGTLDKVTAPAAAEANHQALRAAVLQRLGRHAEAVESYQNALRVAPQQATSWLGLAISLEALGRPEAGEAYRRALGAGPLAAEARDYAEARAAALR